MTTTIDELLEIYKKKTVIKQPGSFRQKVARNWNITFVACESGFYKRVVSV
jgi:hypothetical protein